MGGTKPLLALVGSANSGKTTLFNALTGSHYSTVNYPGATVEYAVGDSRHLPDFICRVMDTPGLTSLSPSSPDEKVTVEALFGNQSPDLVLAVTDANQLSRHLYLVRQLQEVGFPVVVAVTMGDILGRKGKRVDEARLSELLGCPVLVLDPRETGRLDELSGILKTAHAAARAGSKPSLERYSDFAAGMDETRISALFSTLDEVERLAVRPIESMDISTRPEGGSGSDRILLHPVFGLLIFLLSMCGIFTAIFWLATPFMDGIDLLFGHLIAWARQILPQSWLADLVADGLIGGTGAVAVFLPQIVILFFAMGYLEDSGYLARGAALVDRPLSKIGLNGKSFVPLLSGYACAIPAMLAARTISNRFERNLTLFIIPLMSCSARLPVYTLLLSFLIPRDRPWLGGLALTGLYLLGIVLGAMISTVATAFMKGQRALENSGFMLELPALRAPVLRVVVMSTWHKSMQYIRKAGLTIVAIALGLWVLTHTPVPFDSAQGTGTVEREYVSLSNSYAAALGHFIEPIMEPMGLDWRGGVALICGIAAREVFVSALALSYRVGGTEEGLTGNLLAALPELRFENSDQRVFTVASSLGLLVFYIVALQCFPTVAVAKNEMGGWKPALLQMFAFTGAAYLLAVAVVQGLRAMGVG